MNENHKEEKFITIPQSIKANLPENGDIKNPKRSDQLISKADFGLENIFFQSAYAYVNKQYFLQNPQDTSKNVNKMIHESRKRLASFNADKITFESPISHMSCDFKANVDYIWCHINNKLKPFRILDLISYDQMKENKSFPNQEHPSDHMPLVADLIEQD